LGLSHNNKKLKNYEKAMEKFKSSVSKGFFYINNNLEHFNFKHPALIDD
jgi:hypothetical protein